MRAHFVPFLIERMFQGKEQNTEFLYCSQCDFYYASYRPDESEMARLYTGYRDEFYQQQRERHESYYTKEVNDNLGNSTEEIERRTTHLFTMLQEHIDIYSIDTILDFGGDKGQFIPSELPAKKYVYDISSHVTGTRGGVEHLCKSQLSQYKWDFIMCCHVLEHVSYPTQIIDEIYELTHNTSYLYLEVPYQAYWIMPWYKRCYKYIQKPKRFLKKYAPSVAIHEHINMFRMGTLTYLLRAKNMTIHYLAQDEQCIYCLAQRIDGNACA